jgi:hypothetical protein
MSRYTYKTRERYAIGWNDSRYDQKIEPPDLTARKILTKVINSEDREGALWAIVQRDTFNAQINWGETEMLIHDDKIYRVGMFPGEIDVLCLGLTPSEHTIEGQYSSTDELPLWMQERLAVLMMMSFEPPTVDLVGVGRRISSHVYWVYAPETTS